VTRTEKGWPTSSTRVWLVWRGNLQKKGKRVGQPITRLRNSAWVITGSCHAEQLHKPANIHAEPTAVTLTVRAVVFMLPHPIRPRLSQPPRKTALGPRVSYGHHRANTLDHLHVDVQETGAWCRADRRNAWLTGGASPGDRDACWLAVGTMAHGHVAAQRANWLLSCPFKARWGDQRGVEHRVCRRPMAICPDSLLSAADSHSTSGIGPQ
jgi:hypothetical protein